MARPGIARAGSLGNLAEPPRPGEPLWHTLARELRTDRLWSEQKIADALDKPLSQVRKALHPERTRQTNRAYEHRNRKSLSARELAYRQLKAPDCSQCGARMSKPPKVLPPLCRNCRLENGRERRSLIARLWKADLRAGEIAQLLDETPACIAATVALLRKEGVDLQRRRTNGRPLSEVAS